MNNIVLIIDDLVVGGAQTTNLRLAEMFLEKGYKVHFIVLKNNIELTVNNDVNFICLGYEKKYISIFNKRIFAKKLASVLDDISSKYGKINLTLGSLGLTHDLLYIIGNKKFYYVLHGSTTISKLRTKRGINKLYKRYKLKELYNSKRIICVSDGVQKDILSLGIIPKSINTIYNFFDFEKIREASKEDLDVSLPNKYIVHVGRFSKVKRHDVLIKAFHTLTDKTLSLVLLGDGEGRKEIEKLIIDLDLQERVLLLGFIKNPYPIIKNAEALVLSSDHEGFGNVLLEALIVNTPAISTACPFGPVEILSENFQECLSVVGDYKDLARCIQVNLENKPVIKEIFLNKFSKDAIFDAYKSLLN